MRTYTYMYLDTNTNTPQVVDIPPCLALGTEAIEPDAMRRPPRRPGKAILGYVFLRVYGSTRTNATALSNPSHNPTDTHRKRYTLALLLQAVSMGLLGFAAYAIALDVEKLSETQARVCLFRGSVWCSYSVEREHVCVADGSPCLFYHRLIKTKRLHHTTGAVRSLRGHLSSAVLPRLHVALHPQLSPHVRCVFMSQCLHPSVVHQTQGMT